jgi:hypothetical protein
MGILEWEAKREVSRLTGHERGDVTEIYLSSLRVKEADEK